MDACLIEGCDRPVFVKARGWCKRHYHRWYRTGDPLQARYDRMDGPPLERWWAKVDKQAGDGCWLWIGGLDRNGYGQFGVTLNGKSRNHRAHRWGYQQLVRPLDDAEALDHLCRVHACVRPDHLEPVSHAENVARGVPRNSRKTHCPRGHAYDHVNSRGERECSACRREQGLERTRRHRGYTGAPTNSAKTHCVHGHEFSPENTYRPPRGGRVCRECQRVKIRDYMRRRRAAQ